MTSASVKKHTGKDWDTWVALLQKSGAHLLERRELIKLLKTKYKLTLWWQQVVAGGYQIATGGKIEGRDHKGLYSVAGSRTFSVNAKTAWKRLTSDNGVAVWLKPYSLTTLKAGAVFENAGVDGGGAFGEIRVVTKGDKIRFRWQENEWEKPAVCILGIIPRAGEKCVVVFTMNSLPSARAKDEFRKYWKSVLDELRDEVVG